MVKKAYTAPRMEALSLGTESLMVVNSVREVSTDATTGIGFGGGGSGGARTRHRRDTWSSGWED